MTMLQEVLPTLLIHWNKKLRFGKKCFPVKERVEKVEKDFGKYWQEISTRIIDLIYDPTVIEHHKPTERLEIVPKFHCQNAREITRCTVQQQKSFNFDYLFEMFGSDPSDYVLKSELANCCNGIGTVYLAQHKPSNEFISIKKFKMDRAKLEENILIRDEIIAMRQLSHPNILSFHSAFVNSFEVFVVVPLMCYCSCRDAMNNLFTTGFPEHIVCLILRDVLLGLDYLHKKGFIHRSIRGSHILLNRNKAVLCGFRECSCLVSHGERVATLHNLPPSSMKSLNWLAPEVLEQNLLGYTEQSDIYSLGIVTCELANGLEPFSDMATTFMLVEKIRGHQPALLDCSTCPPPTGADSGVGDSIAETRQIYGLRKFSDHFHNFAEICMQRHPIDRPTVTQLQNHVFFKQIKHMTLFEQLLASGIDTLDCTKIKDESIGLSCDFGDMNIGDGTFEWDF